MSGRLTTAFMGSPDLAVPSLRCLAEHSDLGLVVSQPDRPAGRGRRLTPPPVAAAAKELGIPCWQPETLRGEDPTVLAEFDLVVVLAYGELLRRPMLEAPRFGCVNLHGSLLPRWRGASPLQAVIRAGDSETGISVMRMVRALDAGPVWSRYPLPLGDRPTLPCLHDAMADLAAEALGDFLRSRSYEQEPEPQDESAVTMCGKLTTADGRADFSASAEALDRQVRAYTPAPGCWAEDEAGTRIRLQSVDPRPGGDLAPGIVAVNGKEILVGCGEGHCAIQRLQPAGAKSLDAVAFLNGRAAPQRLV